MSSCSDISGCPFSGANECGEKEREKELWTRTYIHTPCLHPPWMGLAISLQDLVVPSVRAAKWTVGENARQRGCSTRGNASYRFRLASFMHIHAGPAANPTRTTGHGAAFVAWSSTLVSPFTRTPTILPSSLPCLVFHDQLVTFSFFIFRPLFDPSGKWSSFSSSVHRWRFLKERVLNLGLGIFLFLFRDNRVVSMDVFKIRIVQFWLRFRGFVWLEKKKNKELKWVKLRAIIHRDIIIIIFLVHVQRTIGSNINEADKHPSLRVFG